MHLSKLHEFVCPSLPNSSYLFPTYCFVTIGSPEKLFCICRYLSFPFFARILLQFLNDRLHNHIGAALLRRKGIWSTVIEISVSLNQPWRNGNTYRISQIAASRLSSVSSGSSIALSWFWTYVRRLFCSSYVKSLGQRIFSWLCWEWDLSRFRSKYRTAFATTLISVKILSLCWTDFVQ